MDETPPDFFKSTNHNQISAKIRRYIYTGTPATKGKDARTVKFNCPTIVTSNYRIGPLLNQKETTFVQMVTSRVFQVETSNPPLIVDDKNNLDKAALSLSKIFTEDTPKPEYAHSMV